MVIQESRLIGYNCVEYLGHVWPKALKLGSVNSPPCLAHGQGVPKPTLLQAPRLRNINLLTY